MTRRVGWNSGSKAELPRVESSVKIRVESSYTKPFTIKLTWQVATKFLFFCAVAQAPTGSDSAAIEVATRPAHTTDTSVRTLGAESNGRILGMRLGLWWLYVAIRGSVDVLPLVNVTPEMQQVRTTGV
eukprot:COSAG02_NODE_7248_length_3097_cov_22.393596_2_plen_128_part_00